MRLDPHTLDAAKVKAISDQINVLLPDEPREALTVLALNFACVIAATRCPLEDAIEGLRRAHRQMIAGGVGVDG